MKNLLQLFTLILFFMIFPATARCELLWEKEFTPVNFLEPKVDVRLYECNHSFFLYYSGIDKESAKVVNGRITGDRYPVIMKIGENGDAVFQNEKRIPIIDSLKNSGITLGYEVRSCKCQNSDLLFDIPQTFPFVNYTPNLYLFSLIDGSLKNINGTTSNAFSYIIQRYQPQQTFESIISDSEEIVLAGNFEEGNQSRFDFHSLIGDENGLTLKYSIILNMDDFRDSVLEDNYAQKFIQVDDNSFIVQYAGKTNSNMTILAKYNYDKEAANKLSMRDTMSSNLVWYTIVKPELTAGSKSGWGLVKFIRQDNGNILAFHYNHCMVVLNDKGKVISNKIIFSGDKYQDYLLWNFMPLKSKPGYYAFWGYYNDKKHLNFAILITDSNWNIVDNIVWNYKNTDNFVNDIKEKSNGNLMVLGQYLHTDTSTWAMYYAELKPNYTSVSGQTDDVQIEVTPNPAGDYIIIASKPSEGFEPSAIYIYNTLGEKVTTVGARHAVPLRIDISALPKGMYFVRIGGEIAKFMKM